MSTKDSTELEEAILHILNKEHRGISFEELQTCLLGGGYDVSEMGNVCERLVKSGKARKKNIYDVDSQHAQNTANAILNEDLSRINPPSHPSRPGIQLIR